MNRKSIALSNKETISYLEQGNGNDYVVLLHGNTSSSLFFTPLLNRLPGKYHVISPDLRGFGESSYVSRFDTLLELAGDIKELLDRLNIKKVVLVGWSLGGGVAMELAAHYPELVSKLILINSTIHSGYPIFRKDAENKPILGSYYSSKEEMAKDPVQVLPMVLTLQNHDFNMMNLIYNQVIYSVNKPNAEDNKLWIESALKQRCIIDADWALAVQNLSNQVNTYQIKGNNMISKIVCPTLHTFCAKDYTTPRFMIDANVAAIKNSTLKVYENSGHSPFVDVPNEITRDIVAFIEN